MSVPYSYQLSRGVVGSLRLSKTTLLFVRRDESASETKYGVSRIRSRPDKLLRSKRNSSSWSHKESASCSNFSCRKKSLQEITSWSIFFELVETLEVRRIGNRKKEPDKTCCSVVGELVGKLLLLRSCRRQTSRNWEKLRSTRKRALLEIALLSKLRFS